VKIRKSPPVLALWSACAFAQSATLEPILKSAGQPQYPALPRVAHIEGEVRLEFVLNQNGEPSSVTVISGHKVLAPAAVEAVKAWRFEFPENAFQEGRKYETTFV
jgi:TonB family protein